MSTVGKSIKADLDNAGISSVRFTLLDFYKPIRGEIKESRSRAGSLCEGEAEVKQIQEINERVDFDDPK